MRAMKRARLPQLVQKGRKSAPEALKGRGLKPRPTTSPKTYRTGLEAALSKLPTPRVLPQAVPAAPQIFTGHPTTSFVELLLRLQCPHLEDPHEDSNYPPVLTVLCGSFFSH